MLESNSVEVDPNAAKEREAWRNASDHAWRYFELHAGQRMTVFNFFTVLTGLIAAGIAASIQGSLRFAIVGLVLGGVMVLLAFVFWKLDQRVSFLIKRAEDAQALAERHFLPDEIQLFSSEPCAMSRAQAGRSRLVSQWTFGASFRLVFVMAALIGATSSALSGLRVAGVFAW